MKYTFPKCHGMLGNITVPHRHGRMGRARGLGTPASGWRVGMRRRVLLGNVLKAGLLLRSSLSFSARDGILILVGLHSLRVVAQELVPNRRVESSISFQELSSRTAMFGSISVRHGDRPNLNRNTESISKEAVVIAEHTSGAPPRAQNMHHFYMSMDL